jgi:two-component system, chemotaxis family, protein-glutamate methylesterase/glutaminase
LDPYVVAIGGSAGGLPALRSVLETLPADFPASVLVVLHLTPRRPSGLAELLNTAGRLPAAFAEDGEALRPGRVFVAPPDRHLLVEGNRLFLRRGPVENNTRPAIDPLFRSAGVHHGSRAIGVVLTGMLSDGASGLQALKRCGGTAIVQDPEEAEFPDMPRNALRAGLVHHVVGLAQLGPLLDRLARQAPTGNPEPPSDVVLEARVAMEQLSGVEIPEQLGSRSVVSCPDCQGALWEIREGDLTRYRCHIGHAYSADALELAQLSELDRALGTALRVLDERIHILRGLADDARQRQRLALARDWDERLAELQRQATLIRQVLQAPKIRGDMPQPVS